MEILLSYPEVHADNWDGPDPTRMQISGQSRHGMELQHAVTAGQTPDSRQGVSNHWVVNLTIGETRGEEHPTNDNLAKYKSVRQELFPA
jgi:hypothetical protein